MHGDHNAVVARIKLPISHETQQIKLSTKKKTKKKGRRDDSRIDWNEHTTNMCQTHQEQALNTTNSSTTTNHVTLGELNDKLENTMTNSSSQS